MGENSRIEWTDHTFNPWVGCTKISPGCDNCYAEGWSKRSGMVDWGGERRRTSTANWKQAEKWDRAARAAGVRRRVFCASLADVFDNEVPEAWRVDLLNLILDTPSLDWLLLTKRISNAARMLSHLAPSWSIVPWPNVWIGATVVNQEEADRDIPKLLATPAAVRFLSCEPLLGPLDIKQWLGGTSIVREHGSHGKVISRRDFGIDWVIAGGESGPRARPMHPEWARSLRDQCVAAGVPFLFKQWGEWRELDGDKPTRLIEDSHFAYQAQARRCAGFIARDGHFVTSIDKVREEVEYRGLVRPGKKAAGRELDGRTWDQFPGTA